MNRTFNINCVRADPQSGICELPASSAGSSTPGVLVAEEDNVYFNNASGVLGPMTNTALGVIPIPSILLRPSGLGSLGLLAVAPTGNVTVVASAADAVASSAVLINNPGVYQIEVSAPFESMYNVTGPGFASGGFFYALMVGIGGVMPSFSTQTVIGNGANFSPIVANPGNPQGGGGIIVGSQTFTFAGGEVLDLWLTLTGSINLDPMIPPTFAFPSQTPYIRITRLRVV